MGFLEDLQKRMSTPGADRYSEERFRKAQPHIVPQEPAKEIRDTAPPLLVDIEEEARQRRRRTAMGIGLGVLVLLIAGGTVWGIRLYQRAHTVRQSDIGIEITAPDATQSGSDVQYRIVVRNDSRVLWQNVVTEVALPEGLGLKQTSPEPVGESQERSSPPPTPPAATPSAAPQKTTGPLRWDLGTMRPGNSVTLSLVGRLVAEQGTSPTLTATVLLTPENAPSLRVRKSRPVAVRVDVIPIDIAVQVPKEAASGERITARIAYQNRTTTPLTGIRIVLTPPPGFVVEQTEPPISGGQDLVWNIASVPESHSGAVTVRGYVGGDPDAVRPFIAVIGFVSDDGTFLSQRQVQSTTTIARRALTLSQIFNNERDILKVGPSTDIEAKVQFKNTGNTGLRDVIVKLQFTGKGLDPATVETNGGFYNSQDNTITWTPASIPILKSLRPGESGEVTFRFRMLPAAELPFTGPGDKNFALLSTVTIDSPDIPVPVGAQKQVISDRFEISMSSVIALERSALYDDGRAGLPPSTGPIQPKVGTETVYTVRVRVKNTSNDVVDAVYKTVLPEGIRWVNKLYTTVGTVTYNERTREVTWSLGAIPVRAGVAAPGPEFAFQIGLTPSLNQVGQKASLTKAHTLDGTDVFTAAWLHADGPPLTTEDVDARRSEVTQ